MADKAISELVAAPSVTPDSLFVLQQDGTAKKLTAQVLENWLLSFAGGHGGIQSWVPLKKEGLVTTYRITLADQTPIDIDVVDGRGIESVKPTSTNGLVVTYTITYNDGNTDTITVTNGEKGDKGDNANVWIRYASQKPTASSHSIGEVADAWIGICSNHMETAPTDWQQYQWYRWKGEKGDPGEPATLVSSQITYQVGDSGTIIPSGSWSESIPTVPQGKYLWTREITKFNTGSPITKYSVSRFGIDGTGAVSTVAGVSPDADGNVPLTAADVKALPIDGGTMEGPVNMSGQKLSGLNAPTADDEAATKGYVDTNKVDKANVVNNFSTTEEGFVADARALKVLNDSKLSMELLWENASPESSFPPQSIAVDLSEGDLVAISFKSFCVLAFKKGVNRVGFVNMYGPAIHAININCRTFDICDNSIRFEDGYVFLYQNQTIELNNEAAIPTEIYVIKGASA